MSQKTIDEILPVDNFYSDMSDCGGDGGNPCAYSCQVCMQKQAKQAIADLILGLPSLQWQDVHPDNDHAIWKIKSIRQEIAYVLGVTQLTKGVEDVQ